MTGTSRSTPARALLRLSQGSYQTAIVNRNVHQRVLAMDLDGYFSRVFLVFFKADEDGTFPLSERHTAIDMSIVPAGRGMLGRLRAELGFLRAARKLIREERVTAISANDPYLAGFNAMVLSWLTGVPYVIEVLSDYDLSYRVAGKRTMPFLSSRGAEKFVERLVLRRAHAVYADRDYYKRYALANGARPDATHRVRCVTDPFYYSARSARPLSAYVKTDRPVMFYAGRLSGEKYPLDLVDCLRGVHDAGVNALLVVAGDGDQREAMIQRARELRLEDSVVLLGNRNAQELVDLMAGSDVLLATHAGYALLEMALAGAPIVAYDYEWHPEVVRHEETGLLVPYRDSRAMADAVVRLLGDRSLSARLGAAARKFALENHDWPGAMADERDMFEAIS